MVAIEEEIPDDTIASPAEEWWEYQADLPVKPRPLTDIARGGEVYLMEKIPLSIVKDLLFAARFVPLLQNVISTVQVCD